MYFGGRRGHKSTITQLKKCFEGNVYLRLLYQKRTQTKTLSFHLKKLDKRQIKAKASKKK